MSLTHKKEQNRTGKEEGKSHGEQKPQEIRTNKRCRGKALRAAAMSL